MGVLRRALPGDALGRPFRAYTYGTHRTQGDALGCYRTPRWGCWREDPSRTYRCNIVDNILSEEYIGPMASSKSSLLRLVPTLKATLSRADAVRLEQIVELLRPDGTAVLANVLTALYPGKDRAAPPGAAGPS